MNTSGLLDIHVLEETTSRVAGLTKAITKQVSVVEELSARAQKALGPSGTHTQSLGKFRENVSSILQIYDHIEGPVRKIRDLEVLIDQGVQAGGWQNYGEIVAQAQYLQQELVIRPELNQFPQLLDSALNVYIRGQENLEKYMRRLCKAVFTPVDGSRYMNSSESVPEIPQEDLVTLSKLESSLRRFPDAQKAVDESLNHVVEDYVTHSLQPAAKVIGSSPNNQGIQNYLALCEDLKVVLLNAMQIFYADKPAKLKSYDDFVNKLIKREINKAAAKRPLERPVPADAYPAENYTSGHKPDPDSSTTSMLGSQYHGGSSYMTGYSSQGNLSNLSRQGSNIDARSGHHLLRESPSASSGHSPSTSTNGPENSSTHTLPPIPGVFSSMRSNSGPVGGSKTGNWEVFIAIDQARINRSPPELISQYKREGLTTLIQLFVTIERQCKTAPITSEFGASPASFLFMPILEHITKGQRGVEVVLSEVATRAYLAKPFPAWAVKSEPGPAARADPVSLFFSDCLDCQYANLLQVATEQLKSPSRIGVFMLSNLAAIEHYIASERSETNGDATLNTVKTPTAIMQAMGDTALRKFAKLMDESFKMYMTDWRKLAPYLMETTMTSIGTGNSKLTGKDREIVKEKFRMFNTDFESLLERHSKMQIKDSTLRARMTDEVKKLIGPLYTRFYLKHKDGDFTKNISKYVKYTPAQFEEAIRL